ncbi:MAG: pyruvate formate lyase family protein [Candidatus Latescibacterota bacterium]|jgi:formate C-acetyltransferase
MSTMTDLQGAATAAGDRLAALRLRLFDRKRRHPGGWATCGLPVATARSLRASEAVPSWQLRRGLAVRDRLAAIPFALDELELLAGRVDVDRAEGTTEEIEEALRYLEQYPGPPGQNGHCELYLDQLMELGIDGLSARVRRRLATAEGEAAEAYQSFLYALEGLARMVANAAATATAALDSAMGATPDRRREVEAIAASCRTIAHQPPVTFRDALQLLWFAVMGVMHGEPVGLVDPGHLDRTLYPFLAADLEAGRLDGEEALVLIESLYLLVNEYIPDGLAIAVMVGGRDEAGNDVTNTLSYLCLEALRRTALIYPSVGICWHEGTPADLIDLAVDLIGRGNANPAFFGDATIQRGLQSLGMPEGESSRYINSTCVEITPSGSSNVWVASPYYNTCQLLLEEITASALDPPDDLKEFVTRYQQRLADTVAKGVADQNEARCGRYERGRKPLQSVFTRDCLTRGRDLDDGGGRYNWVECSFVGLANLADSLHVIDQEVFRQGRLTLARLKEILDVGFDDHEEIRLRFLNGYPKYGQGNSKVDQLVGETVAFVVELCRRFRMAPDDSPYVPGAFVWIMHEHLGRRTGATPDGRRAGFPFADGCGPAQGRERFGPTAAILSTTSWDHSPMIGGLAYNMKFNTSLFRGPEGFGRLRDLILTYLRRGGFETQINVVDHQTLKLAQENPEAHRDLVVRIGGYTDYFTRLSPEMQAEVILRTEFGDA